MPPLRLGPLPPVPQWQQEPTRNTPPPQSARGSARGSSRFAKEHMVRSARGSGDSGMLSGGPSSARMAGVPSPTAELAAPLGLPSTRSRPESARRQSLQLPARLQHSNRVHPEPSEGASGGAADRDPTVAMPSMPAALRMPAAGGSGGAVAHTTAAQGSLGPPASSSPSWGSMASLRLGLGGLLGSGRGGEDATPTAVDGRTQGGAQQFTGDLEEDVERMLEEEERAERAQRAARVGRGDHVEMCGGMHTTYSSPFTCNIHALNHSPQRAAGARSAARDLDTDSESGSEGWAGNDEDDMSDDANTPPTKGPAVPRLTFDIAATAGVVSPAMPVRPPTLAVPPLAFGSPGLPAAGSPAAEASPGPPGPGALLTALEQAVVGKGKMQLATMAGPGALRGVGGGMAGPPLSYEEERAAREVYRDPQLHLLVLQLVLELSLTEVCNGCACGTVCCVCVCAWVAAAVNMKHWHGTHIYMLSSYTHTCASIHHPITISPPPTHSQMGGLDTRYYDQLPLDRHLPNIAYVLAAHLNHPANAPIVPPLYCVAQRMGEGAVPLLKLLVRGLFHKQLYGSRQRVARGAFAQVFRTQLASLSGTVALKAIDMPTSVHDRCAQVCCWCGGGLVGGCCWCVLGSVWSGVCEGRVGGGFVFVSYTSCTSLCEH